VACAVRPCVTTSSTVFSFRNWFFGIYLNFQRQKLLRNQYLSPSESKSYQINSIKSCSSRSFQQYQRHISIPQLRFNLISSEEIIHYSRTFVSKSKCHGTKTMHPSLSWAFQRHQEHELKHPGSVDLITTIQNKTKQTETFLHRWQSR